MPMTVNEQIRDALNTANQTALGHSSMLTGAILQQSTAQALALALQDAISYQRNLDTLLSAALKSTLLHPEDKALCDASNRVLDAINHTDATQRIRDLTTLISEFGHLPAFSASSPESSSPDSAPQAPPAS